MRFINLIVVHCSATRCDRSYTEHDLTTDHLRRGFSGAGYHFYIRKNGDIKTLRPIGQPGAHVKRASRRYPYRFSETFPAGARHAVAARLSRQPPLRAPRPQSRPRLRRRDRARRVDQGVPLLRCGIHSSRFCSSQPRLPVIFSVSLCFSRFFPNLSGSFVT